VILKSKEKELEAEIRNKLEIEYAEKLQNAIKYKESVLESRNDCYKDFNKNEDVCLNVSRDNLMKYEYQGKLLRPFNRNLLNKALNSMSLKNN